MVEIYRCKRGHWWSCWWAESDAFAGTELAGTQFEADLNEHWDCCKRCKSLGDWTAYRPFGAGVRRIEPIVDG